MSEKKRFIIEETARYAVMAEDVEEAERIFLEHSPDGGQEAVELIGVDERAVYESEED